MSWSTPDADVMLRCRVMSATCRSGGGPGRQQAARRALLAWQATGRATGSRATLCRADTGHGQSVRQGDWCRRGPADRTCSKDKHSQRRDIAVPATPHCSFSFPLREGIIPQPRCLDCSGLEQRACWRARSQSPFYLGAVLLCENGYTAAPDLAAGRPVLPRRV